MGDFQSLLSSVRDKVNEKQVPGGWTIQVDLEDHKSATKAIGSIKRFMEQYAGVEVPEPHRFQGSTIQKDSAYITELLQTLDREGYKTKMVLLSREYGEDTYKYDITIGEKGKGISSEGENIFGLYTEEKGWEQAHKAIKKSLDALISVIEKYEYEDAEQVFQYIFWPDQFEEGESILGFDTEEKGWQQAEKAIKKAADSARTTIEKYEKYGATDTASRDEILSYMM